VSDAQLSILNYALLALLYLFFGRVLWAVWSEVRGPRAQSLLSSGRSAEAATIEETSRPPMRSRGRRSTPQRLVVLEPKVRKGAAYPVATEVTLGRSPACAIGLPDDTFASQVHARVFRRDGTLWVEDLGSTNGTHVNGVKVEEAREVVVGDRVQIGSTIFEVG